MLGQKGRTVFSEASQQVISDTPQIKCRTHWIIWVLGALLLFLMVTGLLVGQLTGGKFDEP